MKVNVNTSGLNVSGDTIALNSTITGNRTFQNNVTVVGNFTVTGTTSQISIQDLSISDTKIQLINGFTGTPIYDAEIVVNRVDEDYAKLVWKETDKLWTAGLSAGQVLLNNILCAAFNFTYTASGASPRQLQAVFFDKKWFLTSQGSLDYVTSVPVSGVISMYGVDDKDFYKLYNSSTASINSQIQTALSPMQDTIRTKQALKFGVEAILAQGATFTITVDSEQGSSPPYTLDNFVQWYNNSSQIIPWQNNSSQIIGWIVTNGYFLYKSDAQQYGKYLGLNLTSSDPGFVVSTFEMEHELRVRF